MNTNFTSDFVQCPTNLCSEYLVEGAFVTCFARFGKRNPAEGSHKMNKHSKVVLWAGLKPRKESFEIATGRLTKKLKASNVNFQ